MEVRYRICYCIVVPRFILISLPWKKYYIYLMQDNKLNLDRSDYKHNKLIIGQFTKQAMPFAKKSAQYIDETFERILTVVDVDKSDNVLDVACGTGSISI